MTGKSHPGGRRERIVVVAAPEAGSQRPEKAAKTSERDTNPRFMREVVRLEEESGFVHFYLACGHLITIGKGNLKSQPAQMECWACAKEVC